VPRRPVEREMQVTTSETTYRKTRVKKAGAAIRSEFHRSLLNVSCRAQPARAGSKLKDGFDGKEMDRLGGSGLTNERTGKVFTSVEFQIQSPIFPVSIANRNRCSLS
jgi:hypothetical protein